jgi:uncharacterized membrane protein YhaH (DUF805 family)
MTGFYGLMQGLIRTYDRNFVETQDNLPTVECTYLSVGGIVSRGVELPWHIFGRRIRPFSFALMLATLAVGVQFFIQDGAPGDRLHQYFMSALSLVGVALLFSGWALLTDPLHDWGLLIVSGVWMGRTALYVMEDDWEQIGLYLSACWVIAAVGAWFIERYDHRWQHIVQSRRAGDA